MAPVPLNPAPGLCASQHTGCKECLLDRLHNARHLLVTVELSGELCSAKGPLSACAFTELLDPNTNLHLRRAKSLRRATIDYPNRPAALQGGLNKSAGRSSRRLRPTRAHRSDAGGLEPRVPSGTSGNSRQNSFRSKRPGSVQKGRRLAHIKCAVDRPK